MGGTKVQWPQGITRPLASDTALPNTSLSSEDDWRGPCASTDRDKRLRLLQALVNQDRPRCSTAPLRSSRSARSETRYLEDPRPQNTRDAPSYQKLLTVASA